jgi:hypothetical protein
VSERITVDTGIQEGQELKIVIEVNRAAVPLMQDSQPGTTAKKYEGHVYAPPQVRAAFLFRGKCKRLDNHWTQAVQFVLAGNGNPTPHPAPRGFEKRGGRGHRDGSGRRYQLERRSECFTHVSTHARTGDAYRAAARMASTIPLTSAIP